MNFDFTEKNEVGKRETRLFVLMITALQWVTVNDRTR